MPPIYPRSNIALLDARVVAVAWAALAALAMDLLIFMVAPSVAGLHFKMLMAAFASFAAVHLATSFFHSCPVCGKHPTIQGFEPVHPGSVGQAKLEGWSGVVVNILKRRRLVCIHCGTEFRVEA